MEDLTDMQNHVLPYLQSFCSLEEKSVQEKQERQVAEKQDSRVEASRAANVTKGDILRYIFLSILYRIL